jgi:uncharacterized protein DUF4350
MTALGRLRTHRRGVVVVASVAVLLVVLSVLSLGSAETGGDLDPDNPRSNGAQALARVLARHDVDVTVVRRAAALARTRVDADTTVVVTSTEQLGRATARALDRHTAAAGAVVLASPAPTVIRALRLPLTVERTGGGDRTPAGCDDTLLGDLAVDTGPSVGYGSRGGAPVTGCFRSGGGGVSLVARVDRVPATYAVGATDLLTNARITRADNAAAALRLLGQHTRLVWYVPDLRDVAAGDTGSVRAQLPGGLVPALWLTGAAVVATMLWRGRRLGPLVVEPLPVVVKAVESTQGRGRLYRRVRDRGHAAGILRAATTRRLAAHLRLPPGTSTGALVGPVAQATGRDAGSVADLLVTRPVPDDTALTRLADDLAALEREVHRP